MTIRKLADEIRRLWPDLVVRVEKGHCNTDRKIPGTRLRRPGKGRTGTRVVVSDPKHPEYPRQASILLDHNNAETYRHTGEVVDWIEGYKKTRPPKRQKLCLVCGGPGRPRSPICSGKDCRWVWVQLPVSDKKSRTAAGQPPWGPAEKVAT